ncbi:MAG: sugar phosphate isomerase/epimerase family protein [Planctomycetota bacterium]
MPQPPMNHRYLLSCKLGMITKKGPGGETLSLAQRLVLAKEAGFDGVDLDEAAGFTPEQARSAAAKSGVFVHNAINHDHWKKRFTSGNEADREQALKNLEHCIRVSHAAGGSGVLIVVGRGADGPESTITERSIAEIKKAVPLAAALGQRILFENVWNQMFYDHNKGPEQSADRWVDYVDAFDSPWVGMYHDIGNHWKYGNPGDWIRSFGPRAVKFDLKGFSRASNKFTDIGKGDLPWGDVRKALDEVGFTGWFTAEVGGGGLARLKTVRMQMAEALGVT